MIAPLILKARAGVQGSGMRKGLAAAIAMAVALGGCDLIDRALERVNGGGVDAIGGDTAAPDEQIADVPTAEPGVDRSQWRAVTERTRAVTGNLTVSLSQGRAGPLTLAFGNGLTYDLTQLGIADGGDPTGQPNQTFAQALSSDPRASVYIYRVVNERVDSVAPEGGLCGRSNRATFVAITEYVTNAGDWAFKAASFRGSEPPGSLSDPGLCATFTYGLA